MQNLVTFVLEHTGLNQTEIAAELKVSQAKVSQWKRTEHVPIEWQDQLWKLANITWIGQAVGVEIVDAVSTESNYKQWVEFVVSELAQAAEDQSVTALYELVSDEPDNYLCTLFGVLREAGVVITPEPPAGEGTIRNQSRFHAIRQLLYCWATLF